MWRFNHAQRRANREYEALVVIGRDGAEPDRIQRCAVGRDQDFLIRPFERSNIREVFVVRSGKIPLEKVGIVLSDVLQIPAL